MNKAEIKKQIWESLMVIAINLEDFDDRKFQELRNGLINEEWDDRFCEKVEPRTTKAHQKRFDLALTEIIESIERKV